MRTISPCTLLTWLFAACCIPLTQLIAMNSEVAPTWDVLREYQDKPSKLSTHKAVCVGIITLSSPTPLKLTSFNIAWNGPHISHVSASLYHRRKLAPCAPLHANLVCDGSWDKEHQMIHFPLKEKVVAKQQYYLVLGTKNGQESLLKAGNFKLITSSEKIMHKMPHDSASA